MVSCAGQARTRAGPHPEWHEQPPEGLCPTRPGQTQAPLRLIIHPVPPLSTLHGTGVGRTGSRPFGCHQPTSLPRSGHPRGVQSSSSGRCILCGCDVDAQEASTELGSLTGNPNSVGRQQATQRGIAQEQPRLGPELRAQRMGLEQTPG